ncbi:MAG: hypothetical protein J2P53_14050, partial [Bradyrhizobiaceae bacterium]|nr:hypothetical protein [Bradyrhizobiaceae bacterium]
SIEEGIMPPGKDFASVLQLRDVARKVVLAGCGEPDFEAMIDPVSPHRQAEPARGRRERWNDPPDA